jgi:hypothetical protein
MDGVSPQQEWAGNLADRIEKITRWRPARHVLARLTALLYPAQPEFIDAILAQEEGVFVGGHIVVFTDGLVAVAEVSKMRPMEGFREQPHEESVVSVRVVPRSSLTKVDMAPVTGRFVLNSSPTWQLQSGDLTGWPYAACVSLTYPGLTEPVVVPSGPAAEDFREFLSKLMTDLAR